MKYSNTDSQSQSGKRDLPDNTMQLPEPKENEMHSYLSSIYQERRKTAEVCKLKLIEVQTRIIERADNFDTYTQSERNTDREAMNNAQNALTAAMNEILAIEADAKFDGLVPCRRCNSLISPMNMQVHVCAERPTPEDGDLDAGFAASMADPMA